MGVFVVCAALLGLLAVALAVNVSLMRGRKKISLGDGGDPEMLAAIRAQANFIEFVPLSLILIDMLDDYYGFWTVAALSVVLLCGRVLHAGGLLGYLKFGRTVGAVLTLAVLVLASVALILVKLHLKPY
jgi:uncharacterized membrane protein YecN with MAPEG domain